MSDVQHILQFSGVLALSVQLKPGNASAPFTILWIMIYSTLFRHCCHNRYRKSGHDEGGNRRNERPGVPYRTTLESTQLSSVRYIVPRGKTLHSLT